MVDDVIVPIMQNVSSSLLSRAVRSVSSFMSNPPPPRFCTQGNPRRDGRTGDRGAEHARAGVHGPRRRRAGARVPRRARHPPGHQRQLGRPTARAHGTRGACPAQARREEERDDGAGLGGDGAGGGYWCWWWRGGDWRGRRGGERAAGTQCACAAGEYGHDHVRRGGQSDEEEPDCGAVVYAVARGPQAQVAELLVGESDFHRRSRFLLSSRRCLLLAPRPSASTTYFHPGSAPGRSHDLSALYFFLSPAVGDDLDTPQVRLVEADTSDESQM